MSSTRLLILGVIRLMQPVHGYDVRRELLTWRIEDWANVKPGSIYSGLRTLHKDDLISVEGQAVAGGRPERTTYRLTGEGEKELQLLLRQAWWQVQTATEPLIPALCLMRNMPRAELVAALTSRVSQLEGTLEQLRFMRASIHDGATGSHGGVPEHIHEIFDFVSGRARSELDWSRSLARRLRTGAYTFVDEPGAAAK